MADRIALWQHVIGDERLLRQAAEVNAADVSAVAALRRHYPADHVATALELCRARGKAVHKFGGRGSTIVADVQGIEQASGLSASGVKAKRFASAAGNTMIADLCCGIGGDSLTMGMSGNVQVLSVDRDPLRAWMAQHNTDENNTTACADVADLQIDHVPIHIDPARRDERGGRRAWRLADYQPGPDVIGNLIQRSGSAAVKLSPGIDIQTLPWDGEVEFISESGRLVQAVLWTGKLAGSVSRSATLVDAAGGAHTLRGHPAAPSSAQVEHYLYAIDPSVERAELIPLLVEHCNAPAIHPKLGLLTSDRVIESPWLTGFELIERMPWRPRRIKQWLKANDGGLVEVKTRGKACDPDREQRNLRGDGGMMYTVFVLRFDTKVEALMTKRI